MDKFLDKILPEYDEYSLFVMAIAAIPISFSAYQDLKIFFDKDPFRISLILAFYLFGLFISIKHVFLKRKKTLSEKGTLLFFGLLTQLLIGIYGAIYILNHSVGYAQIFPILNLVYCGILIILFRFNVIKEDRVIDDDISIYEVIIALLSVIIIYSISHFLLRQYWAITFSIISLYAVNVSKITIVIKNLIKYSI
ncbi:MAG: hypothetical protein V1720_14935 [bacterium]